MVPSPNFWPMSTHVYCDQTAGFIKMARDTEVGLGASHIVLHGDPAPLPKTGQSPQFSAHLYCGQTVGCIKMPLGVEVGLGPGDFVFDVLPPENGTPTPPNFWPMAGWMKTPRKVMFSSF